ALRGDCDRPLVLDESIDSLATLVQAHADGVADAITIKLARVGGIGRARLIRDAAVELGIAVTVEDTGGAAHPHPAPPGPRPPPPGASTKGAPPPTAGGTPPVRDGRITMGDGPGLGVEPLPPKELGEVFYRAG